MAESQEVQTVFGVNYFFRSTTTISSGSSQAIRRRGDRAVASVGA